MCVLGGQMCACGVYVYTRGVRWVHVRGPGVTVPGTTTTDTASVRVALAGFQHTHTSPPPALGKPRANPQIGQMTPSDDGVHHSRSKSKVCSHQPLLSHTRDTRSYRIRSLRRATMAPAAVATCGCHILPTHHHSFIVVHGIMARPPLFCRCLHQFILHP